MQINPAPIKKPKRSGFLQRFGLSCSLLILLLSGALLSSCGFHLRSYGETTSNIQALSFACPNTSSWELCHHLKQTLLLNNIQVVEEAALLLSISPMIQQSRVLSLQSNASAAELGLSSEVTYSISTVKDDELKHRQSVHINNSYRHESSALLAKDRERDELQMQLSQQLAEEIVRQISVLNPDTWFATAASSSENQKDNHAQPPAKEQ